MPVWTSAPMPGTLIAYRVAPPQLTRVPRVEAFPEEAMEEVPRGSEARPVESPLPATDEVLYAVLHQAPLILSITDAEGVFTVLEGVFTVLEGAGLAAARLVARELVGQSAFTVFRGCPA